MGEEPHDRSAGILPRIDQSPRREDRTHLQNLSRGTTKTNALDFDDLLLETVRLLKATGETCASATTGAIRYLMIDEYQDTNRPQYELMKLLAGEHHNICVVGDEDQSIYSWRGADIRNILEFEKDFPGTRDDSPGAELSLDAGDPRSGLRGGRSQHTAQGQEPVDVAGGRIAHRLLRGAGRRKRGALRRGLHSELSAQGGKATNGSACAVLYRTNSQSRLVEEALRRYRFSTTWSAAFPSTNVPRSRTCSAI